MLVGDTSGSRTAPSVELRVFPLIGWACMFADRRPGGKARLSAVPSGNKLMEGALLWRVHWETGSPWPAQMVFKISPQTTERMQAPRKSLSFTNEGKST